MASPVQRGIGRPASATATAQPSQASAGGFAGGLPIDSPIGPSRGVVPGTTGPAAAVFGPAARGNSSRSARRLDGERIAVLITAVAIALLPLAVPQGPSNTAPIDLLLAAAVGASLLWAARARL